MKKLHNLFYFGLMIFGCLQAMESNEETDRLQRQRLKEIQPILLSIMSWNLSEEQSCKFYKTDLIKDFVAQLKIDEKSHRFSQERQSVFSTTLQRWESILELIKPDDK